jgi:hypothetical protein
MNMLKESAGKSGKGIVGVLLENSEVSMLGILMKRRAQ